MTHLPIVTSTKYSDVQTWPVLWNTSTQIFVAFCNGVRSGILVVGCWCGYFIHPLLYYSFNHNNGKHSWFSELFLYSCLLRLSHTTHSHIWYYISRYWLAENRSASKSVLRGLHATLLLLLLRPAICSDFVGAAPIFWAVLRAPIAICRAPIF